MDREVPVNILSIIFSNQQIFNMFIDLFRFTGDRQEMVNHALNFLAFLFRADKGVAVHALKQSHVLRELLDQASKMCLLLGYRVRTILNVSRYKKFENET